MVKRKIDFLTVLTLEIQHSFTQVHLGQIWLGQQKMQHEKATMAPGGPEIEVYVINVYCKGNDCKNYLYKSPTASPLILLPKSIDLPFLIYCPLLWQLVQQLLLIVQYFQNNVTFISINITTTKAMTHKYYIFLCCYLPSLRFIGRHSGEELLPLLWSWTWFNAMAEVAFKLVASVESCKRQECGFSLNHVALQKSVQGTRRKTASVSAFELNLLPIAVV